MLGPALSWLGCCGGAGLGGKGGGEEVAWSKVGTGHQYHALWLATHNDNDNIYHCLYAMIALLSHQEKEGRGEDPLFVCSWQYCAFCYWYIIDISIYFLSMNISLQNSLSIQLTIEKEKWKDLKIFLNWGGKRFHDLNVSKWTKEGLQAFQQDSLLPWCPDYAATC